MYGPPDRTINAILAVIAALIFSAGVGFGLLF